VGLRIVHRCPWASTKGLHDLTGENELDHYVKKHIQRRLKNAYRSDLASSTFFNDMDYWSIFKKRKKDGVGHLFQQKRVKNMIKKHESLICTWLNFALSE